nr:PREDICTED: uncharacterized protein LOC108213610 isoform X2 [Daucus carota subsp. sativus]
MLPAKLSYNVLQIFDHNSVSMKLKDKEIEITEDDVFDVLGLPHGDISIRLGTEDEYRERINSWLAQFKDDKDQITAQKLVQVMRGQPVTDNFKMNFLLLMSNALLGTTTSSYIDRQLLRFDDDLDNLRKYNWPEFLLDYLVLATENWNRTTTTFFRGSLVFLTLLYADRVRNKGIKIVERQFPSYKGWDVDTLRERQALELLGGGTFGVGQVLAPLREYLHEEDPFENQPKNPSNSGTNASKQNDIWDDLNVWQTVDDIEAEHIRNKEPQKAFSPDDPQENDGNINENTINRDSQEDTEIESSEEDIAQKLTTRAQDILDAKFQLEDDLRKTREKFPDCYSLKIIEEVICENFPAKKPPPTTTTAHEQHVNPAVDPDVHPPSNANEQDQNPPVDPQTSTTNAPSDQSTQPPTVQMSNQSKELGDKEPELVNDFDRDLSPNSLEQLEIAEKFYLTFSRRKSPVDNQDKDSRLIPSFSLGIDDEPNQNAGDCTVPQPQAREKSTRLKKIGPHARSPYIDRVVDITKHLGNIDFGFWSFLIQKSNLLEIVFRCKGVESIREHIQTLRPKTSVYYSVIDVWATILNETEKYKSDNSPLRFFCTVGDLTFSLDPTKRFPETLPIFSKGMDKILSTFSMEKLEDITMTPGCFLIDNIQRDDKPRPYYTRVPDVLHSHLCNYLTDKGYAHVTKRIRKLKPDYLKMSWQTVYNSIECGIFLMRHMETFKGDVKNWEIDFVEEGNLQDNQIRRLRFKYGSAIFSSPANELREPIMKEAEDFRNRKIQIIQTTTTTAQRERNKLHKEDCQIC